MARLLNSTFLQNHLKNSEQATHFSQDVANDNIPCVGNLDTSTLFTAVCDIYVVVYMTIYTSC